MLPLKQVPYGEMMHEVARVNKSMFEGTTCVWGPSAYVFVYIQFPKLRFMAVSTFLFTLGE